MILTVFAMIVLGLVAGLILLLLGLIGWVVLNLMKKEMNLDIKIGQDKKKADETKG